MKTFKEVTEEYKARRWKTLAQSSQRIYENAIKNLVEFNGDDITKIGRQRIMAFLDDAYDQPGKCREMHTALNNIFQFAFDEGYIDANPVVKLRNLPSTTPIPRWSDSDIDKFIETAPLHLKRAVALALYTGQRRSDLIKMRWDDISPDGFINVIQKKTGKELDIPIHPRLKNIIGERSGPFPYLIWNAYGKPWAANSLTVAVKRHALAIDLKNTAIHGIRKATASKLAEIGCTAHQIAAITGQSLKEVERYTREAQRKIMARMAMEAWV